MKKIITKILSTYPLTLLCSFATHEKTRDVTHQVINVVTKEARKEGNQTRDAETRKLKAETSKLEAMEGSYNTWFDG